MAFLAAMDREPAAGKAELELPTLLLAQRGDPDALRALIERYQRPVFALVSRLLRAEPAACEDVAQETFLRVIGALPGFDARGPARLSTWILTIATRLCIDFLRRRERPALRLSLLDANEEALQARAAEAAPPGLGAALRRAVEALPPAFRAAFLLREVHGLSYEEIAAALEIDLGTVRSRLSRARAALRAALEDHHG